MASNTVTRMKETGRAGDLLAVLPGGRRPGPVELRAGFIVLVALALIVGVRRGFRSILVKGGGS